MTYSAALHVKKGLCRLLVLKTCFECESPECTLLTRYMHARESSYISNIVQNNVALSKTYNLKIIISVYEKTYGKEKEH